MNKESSRIYYVLGASVIIAFAVFTACNIGGVEKYQWSKVPLVLSGNYFIDTIIALIIITPFLIVSCGVVILLNRNRKTVPISILSIWTWVIPTVAIVSMAISLLGDFRGIRYAVGFGFLAQLFSLLFFRRLSGRYRTAAMIGVCLPFWFMTLIPVALEMNGISWAHFSD